MSNWFDEHVKVIPVGFPAKRADEVKAAVQDAIEDRLVDDDANRAAQRSAT